MDDLSQWKEDKLRTAVGHFRTIIGSHSQAHSGWDSKPTPGTAQGSAMRSPLVSLPNCLLFTGRVADGESVMGPWGMSDAIPIVICLSEITVVGHGHDVVMCIFHTASGSILIGIIAGGSGQGWRSGHCQ